MNNVATTSGVRRPTDWQSDAMQKRIAKRYAAERRFKALGLTAIVLSAGFLAFLLLVMMGNGLRGFTQTELPLEIDFPAMTGGASASQYEGPDADAKLRALGLQDIVNTSIELQYGDEGTELFSGGAWRAVSNAILDDPALLEQTATLSLPVESELDVAYKGDGNPEAERKVEELSDQLGTGFNWNFLGNSDATDPMQVGIWGALKGSLITMFVTLALAFPIGVLAALYLEEYAPKNRYTDMIEVSINNLAAVPSIIFGLLGLAVFLNLFGLPRSAALVGGLTLALMTMPVIVISGRNAVKAVPPSIREAALGVGASPIQVVFHHVLPLALPGILTGTIIGMARALGETAPLLMIGMRAFIATPPDGVTDPATVLPVQIFLWSDEVNRGFVEKTSAAIIVLLIFLLTMNAVAIYLRNRFETRW
ncbi:phosphate ABC transporter membrane protein 2, PhoT family (TC 3.A.1.7.1) [Parasphingorhabdus marina DSM 22363]|uniref:Phosphate transport system permease protein PstA n=1 Tax=Parasphingorhabdus marina DSM 22363 TaxID=1123272 RepID=A0A1N6F3R4_9SPHN|nr:phosphate ABC transporter permease PstA [Parasphingorhabdus marina]SIN89905.1 phosphate ABC transporter membrane protein 2, PhoT family (TC 3.A.1.7.1) [Parasphingorhabdus marina DSM 22363]